MHNVASMRRMLYNQPPAIRIVSTISIFEGSAGRPDSSSLVDFRVTSSVKGKFREKAGRNQLWQMSPRDS